MWTYIVPVQKLYLKIGARFIRGGGRGANVTCSRRVLYRLVSILVFVERRRGIGGVVFRRLSMDFHLAVVVVISDGLLRRFDFCGCVRM